MDELEALRRENAEQHRQLARLVGQTSQLIEQLARLNERVAELLAVEQRKAAATPALPPSAPPIVEGAERHAFDERPKAPEKSQAGPSAKKKAKPTGRKPLPAHLEAEEHELRPAACARCGGEALDVADVLVEEKLHVVKDHRRRRVVRVRGRPLVVFGAPIFPN